ncbi:triphosphoribosyl-dephospho-CoA synthase [Streptomyces mangrovisoli]|uniref:triphosphoribosyl-dephospho-CoA synthase n=1 Tax=Streptomyces mangrovisoli TaxID=1428628 RepID=A0A1J4NSY3_9ACTN|nr:triphosphoribosyl-dephospho-CoA synthase [Streptomyces mangrovisoli]OIJ65535.1 2-(5'-triphosphoribosyl)-3'-dephospho CoA synthase [Streptomyces mangrovisoli]
MFTPRDRRLAETAVSALTDQLDLAPKPGLPDPRDPAARVTGHDHHALRWSAGAMTSGLTAMAAAARRTGEPSAALRAELGAIGRCTEHSLRLAGGGHRGALWTLGLLVAGAALTPSTGSDDITATVRRIAAHPDPGAPHRPSHGSAMSVRYGAAGARGEARAGFPHVRRALHVLTATRRSGAPETQARLDALLAVMASLRDSELLHTAGPSGLRQVHSEVQAVLEAGGTATPAGAAALAALDEALRARGWSPRGSAGLLAGALFLDALKSAGRNGNSQGAGSGRR